ncbi:MAG: TonB-dependent receptor [Tannerella sp.]|nr:TonB-dependent receptor [Tannerella sp.]
MRNTIFLLFLCTFQSFSLNLDAQTNIELSTNHLTIKELIDVIEEQTDFLVLFRNNDVNVNRVVKLSDRRGSLSTILDKAFDGTDIGYEFRNQYIILSNKKIENQDIQQSGKRISGYVRDVQGEPVIGATVLERGITNGTTTDADGRFSLTVNDGAVLKISYLGYLTQEIAVGDENSFNIVLQEDMQSLDEVVVIGYGTRKKVNLTSAIATVGGKELLTTPVANLSNALAGIASGVTAVNYDGAPGSGSSLNIRGLSTLNDNSPLIIVDGVPRSNIVDGVLRNGFNTLDPNEIESITVLKDGAAAAIYGARANNGVFLVTTKRGKKEKLNITYSGSATLQRPTMYPSVMSAYQYATGANIALDNAGFDRNNPTQASRYYTDEAIERYRTGEDGADWYKATFKNNSMMQSHNITMNGGSDIIRYFFSASVLDQDGMYNNINYKAYKFRSNVDADITSYFTLGVSIDGQQENYKNPSIYPGTIFSNVTWHNPTYKPFYPDGKPVNVSSSHVIEEINNAGYRKQLYNTFQGSLTANLKLDGVTQGLSANANVTFGKYYGFEKVFLIPYMTYTEDADGNVTNTRVEGGISGVPWLFEGFYQTFSTFMNVGLNYQRTFGKHDLSGLLLYEQNGAYGDHFSAARQDFAITTKDELFASGPLNQNIDGGGKIIDARRALVGRIGYIFNSKYLFDASFRYDGSYIFPKDKRFGFFPSVSAAWRISEEGFIRDNENLDFITNLKPRFSFAQVGNDKVNAFQFQDDFTVASDMGPFFNGEAQTLIYYGVFPNANITWETANNFNMGLDGSFWNGLFGFEFDYFIKNTWNILWTRARSVPQTFGRSLPNENYARVKNQGFEITLSHQNQIDKLHYSLSFTGSYAKNKVLQIDDPANALDFQKQINRPLGFRTGYKSLGLFQSQEEANGWMGGSQFGVASVAGDIKYADLNNDGVIDSSDQTILSDYNTIPRIMFGLSGNATWNNFDFNFLFQGAAQRNIMFFEHARITLFEGGRNSYEYLLDAWSPENKDAKYPLLWPGRSGVNDRDSEIWLNDASYLRLKTIALGYTFPSFSLSRWHINSLRIFVSGQNLLTWSPLKGFDPEAGSGSGSYYPQQKLFSAGVTLNF